MRSRCSALRLSLWLCANPPIGKAFAANLSKGSTSALVVGGFAVRKAKIKLGAVFLQMLFGNVVIRSDKAALEQSEETFNGVRMRHCALDRTAFLRVLLDRVVHGFMAQEPVRAHVAVVPGGIRHQVGISRDLGLKDRLERSAVDCGDVEGTSCSVTLNQRENLVLVFPAPDTATGDALHGASVAEVCFIGLNDLAASPDRAAVNLGLESLADTVRHEPSRFVGHVQHAVQLVARHAFLAGAKQVRSQYPLVKGNLGTLKDGANGHAELGTAVATGQEARTVRLTLKAAVSLSTAAMRAYWAIGPALRLKVLAGCGFVGKPEFSKGHIVSPMKPFSGIGLSLSSI